MYTCTCIRAYHIIIYTYARAYVHCIYTPNKLTGFCFASLWGGLRGVGRFGGCFGMLLDMYWQVFWGNQFIKHSVHLFGIHPSTTTYLFRGGGSASATNRVWVPTQLCNLFSCKPTFKWVNTCWCRFCWFTLTHIICQCGWFLPAVKWSGGGTNAPSKKLLSNL